MSNNEYISQKEIEEIDSFEIDTKILESIKSKQNNTFFKIQIRNILKLIEQNLKDNETIEFHCTGRNYSIDSIRIAFATSLIMPAVSHPILGWNTNCILIKTNMRMIFVEATMGWQYSKHYEISSEIHLVKEKENFYLIVDGNKKKTIIEYNNKSYEFIMECISEKANIIVDKKLKCKARNISKWITYFFTVFFILIIILFIVNIARHGVDVYRR